MEVFKNYLFTLSLPFMLGSIFTCLYHMYYVATADPSVKQLASKRKRFTSFLATRLMLLIYIFLPSVLILINLLDSFEIKAKQLSNNNLFLLFGVLFLFLWVIGEFLIYIYSKQTTNIASPTKSKFYFKPKSVPSINIESKQIDSDAIQILEKINSEQILCCYYENKAPVRLIINYSQLDNVAIYPIKKLVLKKA